MYAEFRAGETVTDDATRCDCGAANKLVLAASGGPMYCCTDEDCENYSERPPVTQHPGGVCNRSVCDCAEYQAANGGPPAQVHPVIQAVRAYVRKHTDEMRRICGQEYDTFATDVRWLEHQRQGGYVMTVEEAPVTGGDWWSTYVTVKIRQPWAKRSANACRIRANDAGELRCSARGHKTYCRGIHHLCASEILAGCRD